MNWFEGGRRITALLQTVIAVAGGAYVLFGGNDTITFETRHPDDNFRLTFESCDYPTAVRFFGPVEIKPGTSRRIHLCFRDAPQGGGIMYRFAREERRIEPPPLEIRPAASPQSNAPPVIRMPSPAPMDRYYYIAPPYSAEASAYMERRMHQFQQADTYREVAARFLTEATLRGFWQRFKEAALWVFGFVIGLAFVSMILGWIIRGFAGISSGKDARA